MKLTKHLAYLLISGCKQVGSYEPEEVLSYVEESMTVKESSASWDFLTWVSTNGKSFGPGNIFEVWAEWLKSKA